MFYTIYKITNKLDNKTYIGMHQTNNLDDGYMGSGKLLKRAINKHGINNFVKEILHVFDNLSDMIAKEAELVRCDETTYNLCEGGHGGFGYINKNSLAVQNFTKENAKNFSLKGNKNKKLRFENDTQWREKELKRLKQMASLSSRFSNKKHSEETKRKMSEAQKRRLNNSL